MCVECSIPIKSVGPHKYLIGVRLKSHSRQQQRLGPMARKHGEGA